MYTDAPLKIHPMIIYYNKVHKIAAVPRAPRVPLWSPPPIGPDRSGMRSSSGHSLVCRRRRSRWCGSCDCGSGHRWICRGIKNQYIDSIKFLLCQLTFGTADWLWAARHHIDDYSDYSCPKCLSSAPPSCCMPR